MSEDFKPFLKNSEIEPDLSLVTPNVGLSHDALARRRMLLKSLGKGVSVASVAAVPMHTLAAITTLPGTNFQCTLSGQQSVVHSGQTSAGPCGGYSHGWYKQKAHWPNYVSGTDNAINLVSGSNSSLSFDMNTPFSTLFGGGSGLGLFACINENPQPQPEVHWICALLNATPGPTTPSRTGLSFPYTAAEVIAFYQGAQSAAALTFFTNYLDNL